MPSLVEDPLQSVRYVGILASDELRTRLDDCHATAETSVGLSHLEADIASTENDQMRWSIVEIESFDMCERPGRLQTDDIRNGRVRTDIEKDLGTSEQTRAAVVQAHLERSCCYETSGSP